MPIRTLVVDDEPLARSSVLALLARDAQIEVVGQSEGGAEALADIRRLSPDLVFLDVEMPECDGLDVLEMLGPSARPNIVLVTAYDKYAVAAFDAGALDYVLKPFDDARFELALARAKERVKASATPSGARRSIAVKSNGRVSFVRIDGIDWIEAADYYSRLHVAGRTHLLRRSMAELERDLEAFEFCRIHRSTIVNLARVCEVTPDGNGDYEVRLEDGSAHRLSRSFRRDFQMRVNGSESVTPAIRGPKARRAARRP
ncbi:MAG TPA: LytTR family DNA-binding domain-containing protein [Candidatus Acidoferrales bacterium]|nr:LytTR family DNA-binding domain-containing protein [Candidatus Acidoferrales bacterium]